MQIYGTQIPAWEKYDWIGLSPAELWCTACWLQMTQLYEPVRIDFFFFPLFFLFTLKSASCINFCCTFGMRGFWVLRLTWGICLLAARFLFPCVPAALLVGAAPGRWDRREPDCHTGTSSFYLEEKRADIRKNDKEETIFNFYFFFFLHMLYSLLTI